MNLDEAQRKNVAEWIKQGLKLSEIQNRIGSELGLHLTYMEVRLLVDDLKLVPKDIEPPKPPVSPLTSTAAPAPATGTRSATTGHAAAPKSSAPSPAPAAHEVAVSVDQIARPGAVVSGQVTFSDGQQAGWYIDQSGRLGLVPQQTGYRPPATDLQQFQMKLESELSRMGF
jgi:hypothetical protein